MTAVFRSAHQARTRVSGRCTCCEAAGLFLAFSAVGWLWEVGLHLLRTGELVNRGTLFGPWLPIYGVGGLLSVLLLERFAARPLAVLTLGSLLCGAIEFAAGRFLLAAYGLRWWDYSLYPLNIDGLVSPLTSLVFGLGCCAALYLAAPRLLRLFRRQPRARLRRICAALLALFALDLCAAALHPNTGPGICQTVPQDGLRVIQPHQIERLLPNLPK